MIVQNALKSHVNGPFDDQRLFGHLSAPEGLTLLHAVACV